MEKRFYLSIFLILFVIGLPITKNSTSYITTDIHTTEVSILCIMDFDCGANYLALFNQFNVFGWTIVTVGPATTITGCEYNSVEFEVDYLYSEISDLTEYDCINIMPGNSHENLMANQDSILNKIKSASDAGVIISAWCRAVRVLAAADVINGTDITGHEDYSAEYAAAGATFHSNVPPIISGNIVTCGSTQFYLREMFITMTQAIGCYENNAPVIGVIDVQEFTNLSRLITINIVDENVLTEVKVVLTLVTSGNPSPPSTKTLILADPDLDNNYTALFTESNYGVYNVDLVITDLFWNKFTFEDITTIEVGISAEASLEFIYVIVVLPFFMGILMIIRKRNLK
ncbi:MAG: DJ-1/PfpI family protein [Asgard group archaeon]|nr:DJ-1/PfpI family protein [Asgard group archaeon]